MGSFDGAREVKTRTVRFYADREALVEILKRMVGKGSHRYVLQEMSAIPELVVYETPEGFVGEGRSTTGTRYPLYWAVAPSDPFAMCEIPQKRGGYRYLFDHLRSTRPIQVIPGGRYEDGWLIETHLTGYDAEAALSRVRRYLKSSFLRVGYDWVSPLAERWRQEGLRLNEGAGRPRHTDVLTHAERVEAFRPLVGTEDDRLWNGAYSDWIRDYEAGKIV